METKTAGSAEKYTRERPSIYGVYGPALDSAEIYSILEALEPRRRRRAMLWWRATLLVLVTLLATALYLVGRNIDVRTYLSPAARDYAVVGRTVIKNEPQSPTTSAVVPAAQQAPATIVIEPPTHQAEVQVAEALDKSAAREPSVAIHATNAEPAMEKVTNTQNDAAAVATDVKVKNISATGAAERAHKDAVAVHKREGPATHAATVATAATAQSSKDRDVDLIAALVSHVSNGEGNGAESRKKAGKVAGAPVATETVAKRKKRIESNRDIVSRADGDSIDALVKRCRTLGLLEGELCRLRICSGLWGTDPACPGTQAADQP